MSGRPDALAPRVIISRGAMPGRGELAGRLEVAAAGSGLERRLIFRIVAIAIALLAISTAIISQQALQALRQRIVPEFDREAVVVGLSVASQLERAMELGIPLTDLVGVEAFFAPTLTARPSLDYLAITDPADQPLTGADGQRRFIAGPRSNRFRPGTPHPARAGEAAPPPEGGQNASPAKGSVDRAIPLRLHGQVAGWLHIGINSSQFDRVTRDTAWDVVVILVVALLTTVEILVFLTNQTITTPLRVIERLMVLITAEHWTARAVVERRDEPGRFLIQMNALVRRANELWLRVQWLAGEVGQGSPEMKRRADAVLARVLGRARFGGRTIQLERAPRSPTTARTPLFLFVFAEQLSTSFIPLFARTLQAGDGTAAGWLTALPITAFVAAIAFVTPLGGRLVSRLGARSVILIGCLPAIAGYAMAAFSTTLLEFSACRALSGVGYSLVTIACQGYLGETAAPGQRARGMAVFVAAVMTGAVCGTATGAVIADRIGFRDTFLVSAVLVIVVLLLSARFVEPDAARRPALGRGLGGGIGVLVKSPRFAALTVFAAIPAKLVLTGFVFFISPLYLSELGMRQPEIGRYVMLYGLAMIPAVSLGAQISDRLSFYSRAGSAAALITVAGVATGIGMLVPTLLAPVIGVLIAIVAVGVFQGIAAAPMLAIIPDICPVETGRLGQAPLFGYLRFAERLGSIVAAPLAAVLVAGFGYRGAIAWIGIFSLVTAVGFAIVYLLFRTAGPAEAVPP